MNIIKTAIEGVVIIEPKVFNDERGYFFESYNQKDFNSLVKEITFVQDNESCSQYGVIRGLHFQKSPYAQSKLVRVVKGRVLDVAVDIRHGSPTFGKHVKVELTENNHLQFFIPKGFAHGFVVLTDEAEFAYKCTDFYHPGDEGGLLWSDPEIGVDWPIEPGMKLIISDKDKKWSGLKDTFKF